MEERRARQSKQQQRNDAQKNKQEQNSRSKTVHPDTVKAVQETATQYKNVLEELANR